MTTSIDNLLESYRAAATTERDKGTYFERLCAAFLTADPVQREQYEAIWTWTDWANGEGSDYAATNGWTGKDVGIDLVAKLRDHSGYVAIQCKFYAQNHRISQADLSGFLTVSAKDPFVRRVVVDSTTVEWRSSAEAMLLGLDRPVIRIGLGELRASSIDWAQCWLSWTATNSMPVTHLTIYAMLKQLSDSVGTGNTSNGQKTVQIEPKPLMASYAGSVCTNPKKRTA